MMPYSGRRTMIDMTRGGTARLIITFTIPMFIGNVFQQLYNVTDSIIVGRFLGKHALAAVGASFPIMFLLIALTMGATMGITVLISQYYGAKNFDKVKLCIETAYVFLAIMAVAVTAAGLLLDEWILRLLKTPAEIFDDAKLYINILFGGLVLLFGYNSISAICADLAIRARPCICLCFPPQLTWRLTFSLSLFSSGESGAPRWPPSLPRAPRFSRA
jgi:Na+-driven multidrug efflux pump